VADSITEVYGVWISRVSPRTLTKDPHPRQRPRISMNKPSASVRGSQEFLRISVRKRTPPSAHHCSS